MTGKELLQKLSAMDIAELNYTVLFEGPDGWVKLATITKDFELKSIDLGGEKK
jgi:hypothetical protein